MVDQNTTANSPLVEVSVATRCTAATLLPAASFPSVLSLEGAGTNAMIYPSYLGAAPLAAGRLALSIGLVRGSGRGREGSRRGAA
jgi:hypothetical protein